MNEYFDKMLKWRTPFLWIVALILAAISFMEFSTSDSLDREVKNLESTIHKRQQVLEEYSRKAIETPDSVFLEFAELPEDMAIYKFYADTLHSWVNQLPISNDDIDFFPFGYTLNHLTSRGVSNTPLAYIGQFERYLSLGSAWYIVNMYTKNQITVVSALLVQTDYPSDNSILKSEINPNLALSKRLSIVPVTQDESYIIKGKNGGVLFSVLKNLPSNRGEAGSSLRWLALFFIITALFSELQSRKRIKQFFIAFAGLTVLRFFAIYFALNVGGDIDLFSPNLYADFGLFGSMADLLINHLYVFLVILGLFIIRKSLALTFLKASQVKKRIMKGIFIATPFLIMAYIHISLKSLILNSNIVLELYKIDEISFYTILSYVLYGLLFTSLLFSLQILRPVIKRGTSFSFLKMRPMMIFICVISLYTLATVSYFGFKNEYERNRVLTTKMSVERDLNIELILRGSEKLIQNDPVLSLWIQIDQSNEMVTNILTEQYFWGLMQKYDLKVTICRKTDPLIVDSEMAPLPCGQYFESEISRFGIPLYNNSGFYFMNNYNGRISYLGVFKFPGFNGDLNLYLEFDSKFMKEAVGYPELLLDHNQMDNLNIPSSNSYAKYLNLRMISYSGKYNYSTTLEDIYATGYSTLRKDGYIHFVNKASPENIIIISRPERSVFPYIVTFSYIVLFYSLMIFGLIRTRRKQFFPKVPKESFRWKITVLILSSLVFALFSMGTGSIWFSLNYFNESNRSKMEEKMQSVQSTLSYYSKSAQRFNDPQFNNIRLFDAMTRLSNNTQIDINIYRPDGLLLRTTQPEIYDRFLIGARMNPKAYKEIVYNKKKQFVNSENIAKLSYYSLYAPLFNESGKLIAIANIPYFSRQSEIRNDASSIIAAIINIYLLLLLAAVFGGIALSNSLSKPLAEISRKMQLLDISQRPEHIDYNNKDELGILVAAYNKMVDDLEASTIQLAQSEREQAWREMARQIAHEIKNPLTPMRLSIQHLMRLKQQNVEGWQEKFDGLAHSLMEQIDILSDAAGEFSSFSRFFSEELSNTELNRLIREQIILFNTNDNISIRFKSDDYEANIFARKTQITRVLVNLMSNAVQSVESQTSGEILVSLRKDEKYYIISIEDDGPGVPDNLTHRLFKPNFTTKSSGTGLGLAICRSIMEQSQGSIDYSRSETLGGANFTVKILRTGITTSAS